MPPIRAAPSPCCSAPRAPAGAASLRHALKPLDTAITQAPGFGAGWEGFLDWLDTAVSGHDRGEDPYEALVPQYEELGRRLALVHKGSVASVGLAGLGSTIDLLMDGRPDDPAAEHAVCTVTGWAPPERLAVDWAYSGEKTSQLEIRLTPERDTTRLVLEHRGVEDAADYLDGWHAHLDLPVAVAEGRHRPPWEEAFAAARTLVG